MHLVLLTGRERKDMVVCKQKAIVFYDLRRLIILYIIVAIAHGFGGEGGSV